MNEGYWFSKVVDGTAGNACVRPIAFLTVVENHHPHHGKRVAARGVMISRTTRSRRSNTEYKSRPVSRLPLMIFRFRVYEAQFSSLCAEFSSANWFDDERIRRSNQLLEAFRNPWRFEDYIKPSQWVALTNSAEGMACGSRESLVLVRPTTMLQKK